MKERLLFLIIASILAVVLYGCAENTDNIVKSIDGGVVIPVMTEAPVITPEPTIVPTPEPTVVPVPSETPAPAPVAASTPRPVEKSVSTEVKYIGNKNSKKFHYPYCPSVGDMKEKNKDYLTCSRDVAISMGYVPCKRCHP